MKLHRIAFEALYTNDTLRKSSPKEANARRNSALTLAHHLRAHGLSATVGYGLNSDDNTKCITAAFIDALNKVCPIQGNDATARAEALKTETTTIYLLHSRLALVLAEGFTLAAKALWPTEETFKENHHA
jgi:hypothetical protein